MSRQQFTSRNDKGQILTFQKSGSTASFGPSIAFIGGSRRVSWRLYNGANTTQTAGNSITYTGFTSDNGIRTIEMRGNSFKNISLINFNTDNLYGNLDLSQIELSSGSTILLFNNQNLTGITNPNTNSTVSQYLAHTCNLIGNLDLTPLSGFGGGFQVYGNPLLTGITNPSSSEIFNFYYANNCNLTGNLDLTPLSGLGGIFQVQTNPYLTGITNPSSTQNFTQYYAYSCNLTGSLDLTPLSGLGGDFRVNTNSGLTGITNPSSSEIFNTYYANNCNLTGNLDLTPLSGLGGDFRVQTNPLLTGITNPSSSEIFNIYYANNCNLTGNLDLTPLSGLGGQFIVNLNPNLTGITHSLSNNNFTNGYLAYDCNLTGTLDLSPLTKLGGPTSGSTGNLVLYSNTSLTNIIFPTSTQFFRNSSNTSANSSFSLYGCNLDYIDFTPLSGATMVSGSSQGTSRIELQNNGMSTTDVNHILVDFSGNATYNPTGWSNVNLNISGTNGAPDSGSGGYNGIGARDFLTGSPYNWTITHT
jgi:hypothetical protein